MISIVSLLVQILLLLFIGKFFSKFSTWRSEYETRNWSQPSSSHSSYLFIALLNRICDILCPFIWRGWRRCWGGRWGRHRWILFVSIIIIRIIIISIVRVCVQVVVCRYMAVIIMFGSFVFEMFLTAVVMTFILFFSGFFVTFTRRTCFSLTRTLFSFLIRENGSWSIVFRLVLPFVVQMNKGSFNIFYVSSYRWKMLVYKLQCHCFDKLQSFACSETYWEIVPIFLVNFLQYRVHRFHNRALKSEKHWKVKYIFCFGRNNMGKWPDVYRSVMLGSRTISTSTRYPDARWYALNQVNETTRKKAF